MALENKITKWWRKKKKGRSNHSLTKLNEAWVKELIGDPRVNQDESKAYVWPPQMGMDKIRPTTKIGKYFVDFASTSSVHGINHLAAPHRHPFERFLTVIFVGGALVTSILLSWHFWGRFQNFPTILVIDHKYRFKDFTVTTPSLLACPLEKIDEGSFAEVFKRHKIEDTPEAREFFGFIANATYYQMEKTPIYTKVPPEMWLTILWELKSKVVLDLIPGTLDLKSSMEWVMTEEGFCMMFFNYVSLYMSYNYWMENNWTFVQPPATFPSLTFFKREAVRGIKSAKHSLKIKVYYPLEVPELEGDFRIASKGEYHDLYINPQEIVTSEDVKTLSVSQRGCKILEEGGLRLWPIFTHNMCVLECKYELIRKECGCYPHFVRPTPGVAVCNAQQLRCVGEKRDEFAKITRDVEEQCGCYSNCDGANYEFGRQQVTYTKPGSPLDTIAKIFMVFPHDKILRELLFGFNDFLAAVGGAGGLFLGASVLSFIEILYFLTIRLFWYGMQLRRERKVELERQKKIKTFVMKHPSYYKETLKV